MPLLHGDIRVLIFSRWLQREDAVQHFAHRKIFDVPIRVDNPEQVRARCLRLPPTNHLPSERTGVEHLSNVSSDERMALGGKHRLLRFVLSNPLGAIFRWREPVPRAGSVPLALAVPGPARPCPPKGSVATGTFCMRPDRCFLFTRIGP